METNELIQLLRENNALLKEIRSMLSTILNDNDYSQSQDMRAFCINVAADIFVSMLTDDEKKNLKNNFRKR